MRWSILESIFLADQQLFNWFHRNYVGSWTGDFLVYLANPFFWTPLWAFLAIYIVLNRTKRSGWYLFFGFGTYVVTYQAAYVLSVLIGRMPPYFDVYQARGFELAAYSFPYFPSMPDWASASLYATIAYAAGMGKTLGYKLPRPVWWILAIFFLARVVPGFAYPLDVALGYLLGAAMAFLFVKLAQNLPLVMGWQSE